MLRFLRRDQLTMPLLPAIPGAVATFIRNCTYHRENGVWDENRNVENLKIPCMIQESDDNYPSKTKSILFSGEDKKRNPLKNITSSINNQNSATPTIQSPSGPSHPGKPALSSKGAKTPSFSSSSFTSASSFPLWTDQQKKEGRRNISKDQQINFLSLIIIFQQNSIKKLQKKMAFYFLKYHSCYSKSRHETKQPTTTPKKRRYETDDTQSQQANNHEYLKDLSKNIFTSPTRVTKENTSSPLRSVAKSRDIPPPPIERYNTYTTPDRNRPPKHPPSVSQYHNSSPLRPTLFTAAAAAQQHSAESLRNTDEKMLSSLSTRLNDLEQLIKSLDLGSSSISSNQHEGRTSESVFPPPPPPTHMSAAPEENNNSSSSETPNISTKHSSPETKTSPLQPTNLSIHTTPETRQDNPTNEQSEMELFHTRISTASIDALRTLHSTHREYYHAPSSSSSPLDQYRRHHSQQSLRSPSQPATSTSTSPREMSLSPYPTTLLPQVPLTDLSLVQSKMSTWRKRYTPQSKEVSTGTMRSKVE